MKRLLFIFGALLALCSLSAVDFQYFGGQGVVRNDFGDSQHGIGIQFNLGFDMAGKHEMEYDIPEYDISETIKLDAATGYSPSLELVKKGPGFGFGLGVAYQVAREIVFEYEDDYEDEELEADVGFIPFYGTIKYNFQLQNGMAIEPVLQLGYNLFTYDDKYARDIDEQSYYLHVKNNGGLYTGIGANLLIQDHYVLRILSKTNHAKLGIEEGEYAGWDEWDTLNYDVDVSHTQIELGVGYRF